LRADVVVTPAEFRQLALDLPEAIESAHMDHPDFRVGGKIFATLGYPDAEHAVVLLPPDDQQRYVAEAPKVFTPAKGAWGRNGATEVRLAAADRTVINEALERAWRKRAPKRLLKQQ
jgi:hypothetical protein